jgi:hypothetical protein
MTQALLSSIKHHGITIQHSCISDAFEDGKRSLVFCPGSVQRLIKHIVGFHEQDLALPGLGEPFNAKY